MPKLSVWMIRSSFIYMGVGFLFGALILQHKGIPIFDWIWRLLNPHIELMIFGWMMQFVMGVAFWILPRFPGENRYGRTGLGWWSFGMLNSGVLATVFGTWFSHNALSLVGRCAMLGAVGPFVFVMWPRVKPLSQYTASNPS
jgi:heme/copper-type cytochrome/quinol oxidase subunit 1